MTDWPITIDEVATRWHCNVRWLKALAKRACVGRRAGKAIIFFEADYEALKAALAPVSTAPRATGHSSVAGLRSPEAASEALIRRKLERLLTKRSPKRPRQSQR